MNRSSLLLKVVAMSSCVALASSITAGADPVDAAAVPVAGQPLPDEFVSIDDSIRFVPSTQPQQPEAQHPPLSTPENVDTGRPPHEWQRLSDDWFGLRPKLEDRGISFNASFTGDLFKNLRGGANTEDMDFSHLTNANLTFDLERLAGLHGGTFFINAQHTGGSDPGEGTGAYLDPSVIAYERRDEIAEIWYEQTFGPDDLLRIKLGKIDANTEFDNSDVGGEFLNMGSSQSPTLPGFTTYPDTAFGGVLEVKVGEHGYVRAGLFDGATQDGKTTGDDGPRTLWRAPADLLWVGAVGCDWTVNKLKGHVELGATYHTGTFDGFDGDAHDGAAGYYAVLEHQLTREQPDNEDDEQGAAIFARLGAADEDASEVRYHAALGLLYTGLIEGRDDDKVGVAINWVNFSSDANAFNGGDEVNVELMYLLQITHYLRVKPDLQYVHNVGGDESLDDAFVAGLRFEVQF